VGRSRTWNADALARWPGVTIPIDDVGGRYYFDEAEADRATAFFPTFLTHHKGAQFAGQPFDLLPWQSELIVRPLFGWKRRADGLRRFRKVLLFIAKKQGKTQIVAGLANYLLFCDGEPGAEIMVAAADRNQAGLLFNEAKAMVEDSTDLASRADVLRQEIVFRELRSTMKVISAEARTKHGPNLHGVIVDELHAQPDRDLVETLERGVAARLQPVVFYLSTAGDDMDSIAYEEYQYAKNLIDGTITDERCLPIVFEAAPEDDWRQPSTWRKANPSLGITVTEEYYADQVTQAINEPRKQNGFKQLHLNIWTEQATVWIPVESWDACQVETLSPVTDAERLVVIGGLDLTAKIDLAAFVVLVRQDDHNGQATQEIELAAESQEAPARRLGLTFSVDVHPFFWMPEETLRKRAREDQVPFELWRDQGFLRVTEGAAVDYDVIFQAVADELAKRYRYREIGYDPWSALQFSQQLTAREFTAVEVPQNFRHLSEAAKLFEALVSTGRVRHDGHPVMRWCVKNAAVKEDPAGNIRPVKPSKKKRIDGVAATVTALSRLLVAAPVVDPDYVPLRTL
jgi:phage terminase large subunit-like protein